MIVTCFVVAFV